MALLVANFRAASDKDVQKLSTHCFNRRPDGQSAIYPERSHLNEVLFGQKKITDSLKAFYAKGIAPPDKRAVTPFFTGVLGASPSYFRPDDPTAEGTWDEARLEVWKTAAIKHLHEEFGDDLVHVELHLDETTPHIHYLVAPTFERGPPKPKPKKAESNEDFQARVTAWENGETRMRIGRSPKKLKGESKEAFNQRKAEWAHGVSSVRMVSRSSNPKFSTPGSYATLRRRTAKAFEHLGIEYGDDLSIDVPKGKSVSQFSKEEVARVRAFKAGFDIIMQCMNDRRSRLKFHMALSNGFFSEAEKATIKAAIDADINPDDPRDKGARLSQVWEQLRQLHRKTKEITRQTDVLPKALAAIQTAAAEGRLAGSIDDVPKALLKAFDQGQAEWPDCGMLRDELVAVNGALDYEISAEPLRAAWDTAIATVEAQKAADTAKQTAEKAAEALQAALAAIEAAAEDGRITGEISADLELPECDLTDGERQAISAALEDPTSAKTVQATWNAATHEAAAKAIKDNAASDAEAEAKEIKAEATRAANAEAKEIKAEATRVANAEAKEIKAEAQKLKAGLSAAAELAVSQPLKAGEQPSAMALQNAAFAAAYDDEATRSEVMDVYRSISAGVIENMVIRDAMDAIDTARAEGRISQPFEERAANADLTDAERRKIEDAIAHDSNVAASIERAWSQAHKLDAKEQELNEDLNIVTNFGPTFALLNDPDTLSSLTPQDIFWLAAAQNRPRTKPLADAWSKMRERVISIVDSLTAKSKELQDTIDTLEEASEIIGQKYGEHGYGRLYVAETAKLEAASSNPKTSVIGKLWDNAKLMFKANQARQEELDGLIQKNAIDQNRLKAMSARLHSTLSGIPKLLNATLTGRMWPTNDGWVKDNNMDMSDDMNVAFDTRGVQPLLAWIADNKAHLEHRPPPPAPPKPKGPKGGGAPPPPPGMGM